MFILVYLVVTTILSFLFLWWLAHRITPIQMHLWVQDMFLGEIQEACAAEP
jgi:hypothetical protein